MVKFSELGSTDTATPTCSVGLNVVETLLSFIFSKHYQCWHDTNIKHAPFYFKEIDNLALQYKDIEFIFF